MDGSRMANAVVDQITSTNIDLADAARRAKSSKTFLGKLKSLLKRLIAYVSNAKNWQSSPKLWIIALVFLRCAYVFLKEFGWLSKKNLKGDHVFLTGAGNGIGRLMAIRFGKLGCSLSLSDVNMQGLEETKQMCIAEGVSADKIYTMHCDVSSRDSITQAARSAIAAFGTVTVLVNNAGIVSAKKFLELSDQMIERTFAVNTLAHFYTVKEFLPGMIEKKRGHVVNIVSMAAFSGIPYLADYTASKAGAFMIDESLRHELNKDEHSGYIKTTCICPYFINTGMFDGAQKAWPMYILDPKRVVDRIMSAVQQEEKMVVLPYRGAIIMPLVRLLPTSVADQIGKTLGLQNQMNDFKGRGDINTRLAT